MATPISWAQDVVTCDLCDNPTQQFCNSCQVSLCVKCVSKHVEKFKSQTHDIVPFTKRKIKLTFPDCEIHSNERCEAHCKQCDVPVCLKCILGPHNGHKYEDMSDIYNKKKTEIEKETREIEFTIIPQYKNESEERQNKLVIAMTKFDEMDKEKEEHREYWHEDVDTIFNKVGSLLKSKRENHLAALKFHQSKTKDRIPAMAQTVQQNKQILKSKNVSAVTNYKSILGEYRKMPGDIDTQMPSFKTYTDQGRELSVEVQEYKTTLQQLSLACLTDGVHKSSIKMLLDKVEVIATFRTGAKPLLHIACVGMEEAWVIGKGKTITRVNIHGSVLGTVNTTCQNFINGFTMNRQGDLVYSDDTNKTVNIVRHWKTEVLISTPEGWHPDILCFTKSGDILVSMYTTNFSQYKIACYQRHTLKHEIDRDEDGQPIYEGGKNGLYVEENNNGDICASDNNANIVVVVDKSRKVRFQYDGTPARRKKSFNPSYIVTDSMSQIIVADYNNDCLHILDQNGQFLKCVDNFGLGNPHALSVDSEGRLWVGSRESGIVKVIQYMK